MKYIIKDDKKYYLTETDKTHIIKDVENDKEYIVVEGYYDTNILNISLLHQELHEVLDDFINDTIPLIMTESMSIFIKRNIEGFEDPAELTRDYYLENGFNNNEEIIIRTPSGIEIKLIPSDFVDVEKNFVALGDYTLKGNKE